MFRKSITDLICANALGIVALSIFDRWSHFCGVPSQPPASLPATGNISDGRGNILGDGRGNRLSV